MEMNYSKYEQIIERISKNIELYEKLQLYNNQYSLFLANGDVLNIKFKNNNISHLLGVKTEYLKQSNKFKPNMNSYDSLKYFIENGYVFKKLVDDRLLNYQSMFSKYVEVKNQAFEVNSKIRTDDMLYAVKYDGEKTYQAEEISDKCDYYIVRKIYGKYYVLGIVKNENIYLPVPSRMYEDDESYYNFMKRIARKQEITYPYLMTIKNMEQNYSQNFFTNIENKEKSLDRTIRAAQAFDATAAVAKDYLYSLNRNKNDRGSFDTNIGVLRLLNDNIKNGNVLDTDSIISVLGNFDLSDDVKDLIDLCNNLICGTNSVGATNSYSEIAHENKTMKQELMELRNEVVKLKEENDSLKDTNSEYGEQLKIYDEAYEKVAMLRKK